MKVLQFAEKHKNIIAATIAIIMIAVISITLYKGFVFTDETKPFKSHTFGEITSIDDLVVAKSGQVLVQSYNCTDINFTELGFIAGPQEQGGIVNVEISYGDARQTQVFNQTDLSANGYTYLELNDEIRESNSERITIKFTVEKGCFAFSANSSTAVQSSECTLDAERCEKNIIIDLRTVKDNGKNSKYASLTVATIVFLISLIFIAKQKNFDIAKSTAFVLAFFCGICIFIFQPFTVPDEATHYRSAYHVSNVMLFDFKDEQSALRMRQCDYDFFVNGRNSLYDQEYISEQGHNTVFASNTEKTTTTFSYMQNKNIPYLSSGLGIAISRLLGLGPYLTFQIARIFNIAMCIVLIYFAIKIIPYGKIGLAAISLIPINLHIMASCSYDTFTFGGVMLLFAYILKIIHDEKSIGWKQLLILAIMIFIVIPQKVVYIGVAALVLVIPKEKFAKPKLHLVFKCGLGIIAVASILAIHIQSTSNLVAETVGHSGEAGFSIGYVLSHPIQIVKMLLKTILVQGDFYIKSLISFFGWFEMETPWFMAVPYVAILCLCFMRKRGEPIPMGYMQRLYSLALFVIVFALIELLLLIDHTPMSSEIVLGVQGRYFLPALPLLMIFLRGNAVELKENFDKKMLYLISVFNSGLFIYCTAMII